MATENKRVEVEEMEENKNIVPVKAEIVKEKKKKHPVRNIIIAIVAVFFLSALVFGGDDSDSTPASNTKETQLTRPMLIWCNISLSLKMQKNFIQNFLSANFLFF